MLMIHEDGLLFFFDRRWMGCPDSPAPMLCISSCTQQNELLPVKAALFFLKDHILTTFSLLFVVISAMIYVQIQPTSIPLVLGHPLLFFLLSLSVADVNSRIAGALILSDAFAEWFVSVRFPYWGQTLPSDMRASSHWLQWDSQPSEAPIWLLIFSGLKNTYREQLSDPF